MGELEELKAAIEKARLKRCEYNRKSYHKRKSAYVKFRKQINQIEHDHLVKCLEEYRAKNK